MALRMRVYSGLLHQDLIKRHELPASGRLPPILPIVLYTGQKPWRSARCMNELVTAGMNEASQAATIDEYLLLDVRRLLSDRRNRTTEPLAALLELRFFPAKRIGRGTLGSIASWLRQSKSEELRRTVLAWIRSSLPAALAESRLKQMEDHEMLIMRIPGSGGGRVGGGSRRRPGWVT